MLRVKSNWSRVKRMQNPLSKLVPYEAIELWRTTLQKKILVMTNGCFDLLHVGHVRYLQQAKALGDLLWVGLNSDRSVRELKGKDRPLNSQDDRAEVLAALSCVDFVTIFDEIRCDELIRRGKPTLYVKGGDYTVENLDPSEREALKQVEAKIQILPLVPGRSTTALLQRMNS